MSVDTGSGEIDVELPGLTEIVREHGEYHARLGQGHGKLKIETSSGDVKLRQSPDAPPTPPAMPELGALPHQRSEPSVPKAPKAPKPPKSPKS